MKRVIASASLLALGAVGVQTAQAQMTARTDKPWSVAGTLRGFYDDNYNTQPDGASKQGSWGFEISPQANLKWSDGPNSVTASYIYSLRYYDRRPGHKDDQDHDFELSLNHNFNERYTVDFKDSFVIAQEPAVLDPSNLSLPSRSNGNNIRNNAQINFHAQLTQLFGMVVGYGNTFYSYEENAGNTGTPLQPSRSAELDRVEQHVTLDSTWQIASQTVGILGYQFSAVNYTSQESINQPPGTPVNGPVALNGNYIPSDSRNNYGHAFYLGADHAFRSDLTASFRAGVQYFDYYNIGSGQSSSDLSPYATFNVSYAYMDGGSASLGFSHTHNQTDQTANITQRLAGVTVDQDTSTVFGTIQQRLTPLSPNLTATLTGQYQNSTFNGGPANGLADNLYLLGLNFTYQFNHYFSAETGYNYDKVSSELPGRGYTRNRVYVGVTATY